MAEASEEPPLEQASPEAAVVGYGDRGTVWLLCQQGRNAGVHVDEAVSGVC